MRGYPRNRLTDRSGARPVVTKTAQSRGYTISYEDAGVGQVIVLITGATMSAADWRDAGYVDTLADDHRVLSVDPLGNGLSDKPRDPEAYGWPDVAGDVLAVMDAADVGRAVLWGYSRGGRLAAAFAAENPDRAAALIVHDAELEDVARGTPIPAHVAALMAGDFGPMWADFGFSEDDRRYDEEVNDPRALGGLWAGLRRSGSTIDVGRIVAPTLVIKAGDDDLDLAGTLAESLDADLEVMPGLDHLEAFSRLDLVVPIVRRFLEPIGL